jgi:hypothetical protein
MEDVSTSSRRTLVRGALLGGATLVVAGCVRRPYVVRRAAQPAPEPREAAEEVSP